MNLLSQPKAIPMPHFNHRQNSLRRGRKRHIILNALSKMSLLHQPLTGPLKTDSTQSSKRFTDPPFTCDLHPFFTKGLDLVKQGGPGQGLGDADLAEDSGWVETLLQRARALFGRGLLG